MSKQNKLIALVAEKEEDVFSKKLTTLPISDRVKEVALWLRDNERLNDECFFLVHDVVIFDKIVVSTTGDYGKHKEEWYSSRASMFEKMGPYNEIIMACECWTSDSGGRPDLNADRQEDILVVGLSKTHTYNVKMPVSELNNPTYVPEVIVKERGDEEGRLCLLLSSQRADEIRAKIKLVINKACEMTGFNMEQLTAITQLINHEQNGVPREELINLLNRHKLQKHLGLKKNHISMSMDSVRDALFAIAKEMEESENTNVEQS